MITIYVTHGTNYVMSKELFAPTGILQRNKEEFAEQTEGNAFIISEAAYNIFPLKQAKLDRKIALISLKLCELHKKPNENYAEYDDMFIVRGYEAATQLLNSYGHRDITILGDLPIFEEAVKRVQNVQRLITVQVGTSSPGDLLFPSPLSEYFNFAYKKRWPKGADNPYDALLEVRTKRY